MQDRDKTMAEKAITAAIFYINSKEYPRKVLFFGVYHFSLLPTKGSYIEVTGQKLIAYEVSEIIFLQENSEKWDIALLIGDGLFDFPAKTYFDTYLNERNRRYASIRQKKKDTDKLEHPNEHWQRRKKFYERLQAGETAEQIAAEEKISSARVKHLSSEWEHLLTRITLYREENEK